MKIKSLQKYVCMFLTFLLAAGCVSEFEDELIRRDMLSFQLQLAQEEAHQTVPGKLTVIYLLAKQDGTFVHEIQSDYQEEAGRIVMEPLPLGEYTMYILAYNERLKASGLRINQTPSSVNDVWFFFENNEVPMMFNGELYHTSYSFHVSKETEETFDVDLSPVLSYVRVTKIVPSLYLENSIRDIRLSMDDSLKCFSELTVSGALQGESVYVNEESIADSVDCFFMPQIGEEPLIMHFSIETENHKSDLYKMTETAELTLNKGMRVDVNLDLSDHPDSKNGMLYLSRSYYDKADRGLILQDNEPKSIFYDENERSFKVNRPLQLSINGKNELHSRFYSPVPVKNVSVWSSDEIYGARVLLAFYDSIPAFCDARFPFSDQMPVQEFTMESNSKIQLTPVEVRALIASGLEFECEDPFMEKINRIKTQWYIRFHSFGGNPDAWDGGPVGNWMGIRPVHIREAIAIWLNVAYMITLPDFEELVMSYQGQLYGNAGPEDIIDVSTIIPAITNHSGFNVGLIYTGNGVDGLGGGRTWGVAQHVFVGHYVNTYAATVVFHELGHCIGYSHSSNMTYGLWASGLANVFYLNNIARFPVCSAQYLQTNLNSNLY